MARKLAKKRKKPSAKKKTSRTSKKKRASKKAKKKRVVKKKTIKKKVKKKVSKRSKKKVKKKIKKKAKKRLVRKPAKKKPKKKTKKAKVKRGRAKPKAVPVGRVSSMKEIEGENIVKATLGFEQLITNISQKDKNKLQRAELEELGLKTFEDLNKPPASSKFATDLTTLLTVAPHFVFTYWEVSPQTIIDTARNVGPDAKLVLRFFDVTDTTDLASAPNWDIEIFDRQGNWYLKLENPDQRLFMEVGMRSETGAFTKIGTARTLLMPKQVIGTPGPIKWIETSLPTRKTTTEELVENALSNEEEYTVADRDLLKRTLGPYFFDLLMRGRFESIPNSSIEAIFHDLRALRSVE